MHVLKFFICKLHYLCFLLQGAPEHYQNLPSQNFWNWDPLQVPQQVPERVQIQVQTALIVVPAELVLELFLKLAVELAPELNSTSFDFGGFVIVLELHRLQVLSI